MTKVDILRSMLRRGPLTSAQIAARIGRYGRRYALAALRSAGEVERDADGAWCLRGRA